MKMSISTREISIGLYQPESGTVVRLTQFLPKRVPSIKDFNRQLGIRFAFVDPGFHIHIKDTRPDPAEDYDVEQFRVETHPETRIDVANRPVRNPLGRAAPG